MQRFSVYLGKDVAALPSFTGVCSVLVFTWVTLQQPQKQHYPILAMCEIVFTWVNSSHRSAAQFHQWYVVFLCFHLGKTTARTRAELPRPTTACDILVFIYCYVEHLLGSPKQFWGAAPTLL